MIAVWLYMLYLECIANLHHNQNLSMYSRTSRCIASKDLVLLAESLKVA